MKPGTEFRFMKRNSVPGFMKLSDENYKGKKCNCKVVKRAGREICEDSMKIIVFCFKIDKCIV